MSGKKTTGHEKLIRLCVRDDWKCWICGGEVPLDYVEGAPSAPTRDHIVPRSRFRKKPALRKGLNLQENIRLAHKYCNNSRSNRKHNAEEAEKYAEGLREAQEKFDEEHGALV